MAIIEAKIDVTVECDVCKSTLKAEVRRGDELYVMPCEACLLIAHNEGYDAAREKCSE